MDHWMVQHRHHNDVPLRLVETLRACSFPRSTSARLPSWHENAGCSRQRSLRATFPGASHARLVRILDKVVRP
jgi:hypothetical protein